MPPLTPAERLIMFIKCMPMHLLLLLLSSLIFYTVGLLSRYLLSKFTNKFVLLFITCVIAIITTSCVFVSTLISFSLFSEVHLIGYCVSHKLGIGIGPNIGIHFFFDCLTVLLYLTFTLISFFVYSYLIEEYMTHDSHLSRIMSYLFKFISFMTIFVTAVIFKLLLLLIVIKLMILYV